MTAPPPAPGVVPGRWRPAEADAPTRDTLEVRAERLVQDWSSARRRAEGYLEALGFDATTRTELSRRAVEAAVGRPDWSRGHAVAETMHALRDTLFGPEAVALIKPAFY